MKFLVHSFSRCIPIIALMIASAGISTAQKKTSTPEAVASRYMDAISSNDWQTASQLMHPEALDNLKRIFLEIASLDATNGFITHFFGEEMTPAAFERLSSQQVFAEFMSSITELRPEIGEALGSASATIVGHVVEGKDVTHVVYRMNLDVMGAGVSKVSVMSLKRHGDSWRLLLNGDIENMAEAMRQAARQQQEEESEALEYEEAPEYEYLEPDEMELPDAIELPEEE